MATAVLSDTEVLKSRVTARDDRHGLGFALLLTTTATLFIRPADLVPALENWPIYQFLIIACLAVSARPIMRQLSNRRLHEQPVTACLLWLMIAIGASHLVHGFLWGARMSMWEFAKVAAYYLLVVGLINTPKRLFVFTRLLTLAITAVAALALLDRSGLVAIAALESISDSGEGNQLVERIRGTGIFHDPNDFGLILVLGLTLSTAFLFRPRAGWVRYLWIAPTLLLLVVLALTHSRGAFLALSCAIPAAVAYRRGMGLAFLSVLVLPLLAVFFSGRMTNFAALNQGTGQTRIQIWSNSLEVLRENMLFGIGEGLLVEESGVVAHNSYIHCFAELGLFGGTAFVACVLAAGLSLWESRSTHLADQQQAKLSLPARDLANMQVFIFASLAGYAGGMLALSRQFITPTYLVLGLATATQLLSGKPAVKWKANSRLLILSLIVSAACLLGFHILVRTFVNW